MRRCILVIIILITLQASEAAAGTGIKKDVRKANILYNKGKFKESLKHYEKAFSRAPDSDVVNFNLGTALYKLNDYGRAINHFNKALVSGNKALGQKANYNLANSEYKSGVSKEKTNPGKALELLKKSLRHYERALEIDPKDDDAKYNYDFVKKELERLKKSIKEQARPAGKGENKKKPAAGKQGSDSKGQKEQASRRQGNGGREGRPKEKEAGTGKAETERADGKTQKTPQGQQDKPAPAHAGQKQTAGRKASQDGGAYNISKAQADMLLNNYRESGEPRGLYRRRFKRGNMPKVAKDW